MCDFLWNIFTYSSTSKKLLSTQKHSFTLTLKYLSFVTIGNPQNFRATCMILISKLLNVGPFVDDIFFMYCWGGVKIILSVEGTKGCDTVLRFSCFITFYFCTPSKLQNFCSNIGSISLKCSNHREQISLFPPNTIRALLGGKFVSINMVENSKKKPFSLRPQVPFKLPESKWMLQKAPTYIVLNHWLQRLDLLSIGTYLDKCIFIPT